MKKYLLVLLGLSLAITLFAQNNGVTTGVNPVVQGGVGLGSVIAVVASWSRNKSISWAILHGFFGWLYVIHFAFTRNQQ